MGDRLDHALDVAARVHDEAEPFTAVDAGFDDIDTIREAVDLYREVKRQQAALSAVKGAAAERLGQLLGEGGAVRVGDRIVRYRRKRTERLVDGDGANQYLTGLVRSGDLEVADLVNLQYAKRSALPEAARHTFYQWESADEPSVEDQSLRYAPDYLAHLDDGEWYTKGGDDE